MADCIFCNIITGEIPATRIYEDADTLAFLDIHPNTKGHTLIIPKVHVRDVREADTEQFLAVMKTVQKVAPAILAATGAQGFNLTTNTGRAAGQVIMHWHMHLIPRHDNDGLKFWPEQAYAEGESAALAKKVQEYLV